MIFIVPSRGRPQNIAPLIEAWESTRHTARLFIVVNDDDELVEDYRKAIYDSPQWVSWLRVRASTMVQALNYATQHLGTEDVIGFMGDDHRPETYGWDVRLQDALRARPGIAWGNDTIQGVKLPTHVAITGKIVRALGHMAPASLKHLYVDNYWLALGRGVGLTYLGDVIIRHHHPIAGHVPWDEGYKRVNDGALYQADERAFTAYLETGAMDADIKIALGALNG